MPLSWRPSSFFFLHFLLFAGRDLDCFHCRPSSYHSSRQVLSQHLLKFMCKILFFKQFCCNHIKPYFFLQNYKQSLILFFGVYRTDTPPPPVRALEAHLGRTHTKLVVFRSAGGGGGQSPEPLRKKPICFHQSKKKVEKICTTEV